MKTKFLAVLASTMLVGCSVSIQTGPGLDGISDVLSNMEFDYNYKLVRSRVDIYDQIANDIYLEDSNRLNISLSKDQKSYIDLDVIFESDESANRFDTKSLIKSVDINMDEKSLRYPGDKSKINNCDYSNSMTTSKRVLTYSANGAQSSKNVFSSSAPVTGFNEDHACLISGDFKLSQSFKGNIYVKSKRIWGRNLTVQELKYGYEVLEDNEAYSYAVVSLLDHVNYDHLDFILENIGSFDRADFLQNRNIQRKLNITPSDLVSLLDKVDSFFRDETIAALIPLLRGKLTGDDLSKLIEEVDSFSRDEVTKLLIPALKNDIDGSTLLKLVRSIDTFSRDDFVLDRKVNEKLTLTPAELIQILEEVDTFSRDEVLMGLAGKLTRKISTNELGEILDLIDSFKADEVVNFLGMEGHIGR